MSDHLDTVQRERAKYPAPEYDAQGVLLNPLGEANAFAITNATAYAHRGEGWGLLAKPDGINFLGFKIDALINARDRVAIDCLGSSETVGNPQWSAMEWEDRFAALWRNPLTVAHPEPEPEPEPEPDDLAARLLLLERRVHTIESVFKTAGTAMP